MAPARKNPIKKKNEALPENIDDILEDIQETSKDIDEIQGDVGEIQEDVEELHEDVGEIQSDVEEIKKGQKSLLSRISSRIVPDEFAWDDLAQQIVGAMVLSTPLAVTQEVWILSQQIDVARLIAIVFITLLFDMLLIYHTKYQLVKEQKILSFIPLRLFSLLIVSYLSAALMLWIFGVIGYEITAPFGVLKLIVFVGLFANIGAGTADLLKWKKKDFFSVGGPAPFSPFSQKGPAFPCHNARNNAYFFPCKRIHFPV